MLLSLTESKPTMSNEATKADYEHMHDALLKAATDQPTPEPLVYLIAKRTQYGSQEAHISYYETHGPKPGWTAMNHIADRFNRQDIDKLVDILYDLTNSPTSDHKTTTYYIQRIHLSRLEE